MSSPKKEFNLTKWFRNQHLHEIGEIPYDSSQQDLVTNFNDLSPELIYRIFDVMKKHNYLSTDAPPLASGFYWALKELLSKEV